MKQATQTPTKLIEAPHPSLLPHMIGKNEIPVLVTNEENAEESRRRRDEKRERRQNKNRQTKLIGKAAAYGAAAVTFLVAAQERGIIGPDSHPTRGSDNSQVSVNTPENDTPSIGMTRDGATVKFPGSVSRG